MGILEKLFIFRLRCTDETLCIGVVQILAFGFVSGISFIVVLDNVFSIVNLAVDSERRVARRFTPFTQGYLPDIGIHSGSTAIANALGEEGLLPAFVFQTGAWTREEAGVVNRIFVSITTTNQTARLERLRT